MNTKESKLLRAMCGDLRNFVLPQLPEGDATERVEFMLRVLRRLAAEGDVYPALAPRALSSFRSAIKAAAFVGGPALADTVIGDGETQDVARSIEDLRAQMAKILIHAGPDADAVALEAMANIAEADRRWCSDRSRGEALITVNVRSVPRHSIYDRVTKESMTAYLRNRFPEQRDIECSAIQVLPGGRSKKTLIVTLSANARLPEEFIMRQEDSDHLQTSLSDEYPLLASLLRSGIELPIPDPLHFEGQHSTLGKAFLFMKRLPGRALGDFTGFQLVTHEILDDLAKALAKIHSIDIGALTINGQDRDRSQEDRMQKKIASQWQQWRSNTVEQSPLIEYTFGWLQRECRTGLNPPVLVHGDIRPHNLLGENGRLTGILDWELAHIGDPVEDLAYLRPVIHTLGHWPQFMEVYRKHGGGEFDERLFRIYGAWGLVRNASFGARSARLHLNDEDPDFTRGAVGYYSIPMLEAQLAEVLDSHILGK